MATDPILGLDPVRAAIVTALTAVAGLFLLAKKFLARRMKAELRRESDARLLRLERRVRRVVIAQRANKTATNALETAVSSQQKCLDDTVDGLAMTREEMAKLTGGFDGLKTTVEEALAWIRKLAPGG